MYFWIQVLTRGKELGCQATQPGHRSRFRSLWGVDSEVFSGNIDNCPTPQISLASQLLPQISPGQDFQGYSVRPCRSPRPVKAGDGRNCLLSRGLRAYATCSLTAMTHHSHHSVRSAPPQPRGQGQGLPEGGHQEERPRKEACQGNRSGWVRLSSLLS